MSVRTSEPLLRHVIGGILRTARLSQGRTLTDVALAARVSIAYLSEIERGRKEASSEVLAAVCGALGLRLVDLVVRTGDELREEAPVRVLSALRGPSLAGSAPGRERLELVPGARTEAVHGDVRTGDPRLVGADPRGRADAEVPVPDGVGLRHSSRACSRPGWGPALAVAA